MANKLFEDYKGRLAISEKYFSDRTGQKMSNARKMTTAVCLNNISKFMNEAFTASAGTQRSDLGAFKTFCLDITSLTTPNLIVNDLFITQPMSSFQGYLTYMEYGLGNEKGMAGGYDPAASRFGGDTADPDYLMFGQDEFRTVTQNPFVYAPMTEEREAYTSERVIESVVDANGAVNWTKPLWADQYKMLKHNAFEGLTDLTANSVPYFGLDIKDGFKHQSPEFADFKFIKADGTVAGYAKAVPNADGTIQDVTVPADAVKVLYIYNNQVIPQEKLPTVRAHMRGISLEAKARRIAIAYSQFAAFQSKTDYGMSFESTIAQQAQAELEYEVDSEAVFLIKRAADRIAATGRYRDGGQAVNFVTKWIDEELDTISTSMKAEGFAKKIEEAKMKVYRATGRFMPTWMLVNPEMMPILTFVPGFKANSSSIANGPYVAGTIGNMKVIVSPALEPEMMASTPIQAGVRKGVCYLGVLGSDGKTATGVYAPYMPIVPTQLLGFADGTMSQGFSSMYDMKILNDRLLGRIDVYQGNDAAKIGIFNTSEAEF